MTYAGIFCAAEAEIQCKEGAGVSGSVTDAMHTYWSAEVESYINILCNFNFSDDFTNLNSDLKYILREAASCMVAIYGISYDMSGYTSRVEAENMINILWLRFNQCLDLLKDSRVVKLIKSS